MNRKIQILEYKMERSIIMQFHDTNIPIPFLTNQNHEYHFGTLNVMVDSEILKQTHKHFIFSIDKSGSMSYRCKDNKTKLQHIQFTLENMLRMFVTSDLECSIHINVFDEEASTCISNTLVNKDNVDELLVKINAIEALGSTNLEDALKLATKDILQYKEEHPDHDINHILLTDGVPTVNHITADILKQYVLESHQNIFLGYGTDHDPMLLEQLANNQNGSYFFIDALEKASLVYGEIIYNITNKILVDVTYTLNNAEIYNYMTNTWDTTLSQGMITNKLEKTFQIRSKNSSDAFCVIHGTHSASHKEIEMYSYLNKRDTDLTKYAFRQKTQELLFQAKTQSATYVFRHRWLNEIESPLKKEIHEFLVLLMDYRKEHDLEDDKFTKMLCDDLFITYKTIGTDRCCIYTCARQSSQGRQTTYHVSLDDDDINEMDDDDDAELFPYLLSDHIDSPYATNDLMETMLTCSQTPTQIPEFDYEDQTEDSQCQTRSL